MKSRAIEWIEELDRNIPFQLYDLIKAAYHLYCKIFTPIERILCPLKVKIIELRTKEIQLHIGCGKKRKEGFVNIDVHKSFATDIVADARNLPFSSESISRIESYHMIEHIPHPEVKKLLAEWYRVLEKGGEVVIECPDFDANVRNYLDGDDVETSLYYIYGRQRFAGDYHYMGYNAERLIRKLKEVGFTEAEEEEPQDYHKEEAPCLRVRAEK